jgi:hypothetical protein
MKIKYRVAGGLVILAALSCNSHITLPPSSQLEGVPIIEEVKLVNIEDRLLGNSSLGQLVLQMEALVEDCEAEPKAYLTNEHQASIEKVLQNLKEEVASIRDETIKFLLEKLTADEYLSFLLEKRLKYLSDRKNDIDVLLNADEGYNLQPTSQRLFEYVNEELYKKKADKEPSATRSLKFNKRIRTRTISHYEFLQLLIKEAFSSCKLEELNKRTIDLLRASVQLHPILSGEQETLGHPDEAVTTYFIADALLFGDPKNDEANNKKIRSIKEAIKLKYHLGMLQEHKTPHWGIIYAIPKLIKRGTGLSLAKALQFLYRNLDVEVSFNHCVMGLKPVDINYGRNIWPYPLPTPDFLPPAILPQEPDLVPIPAQPSKTKPQAKGKKTYPRNPAKKTPLGSNRGKNYTPLNKKQTHRPLSIIQKNDAVIKAPLLLPRVIEEKSSPIVVERYQPLSYGLEEGKAAYSVEHSQPLAGKREDRKEVKPKAARRKSLPSQAVRTKEQEQLLPAFLQESSSPVTLGAFQSFPPSIVGDKSNPISYIPELLEAKNASAIEHSQPLLHRIEGENANKQEEVVVLSNTTPAETVKGQTSVVDLVASVLSQLEENPSIEIPSIPTEEVALPTMHVPKESNDDTEVAAELATYTPDYYKMYNKESTGTAALPQAEEASSLDYKLPHGMRSFNSYLSLPMIQPMLRVPSNHQKTVDKLFDLGQQCSVKFREFESLWASVGGSIEGEHGGSHRRLVGPDGTTITGIFTKGKGTVYGKKSIQYLQAALSCIGVYPTK